MEKESGLSSYEWVEELYRRDKIYLRDIVNKNTLLEYIKDNRRMPKVDTKTYAIILDIMPAFCDQLEEEHKKVGLKINWRDIAIKLKNCKTEYIKADPKLRGVLDYGTNQWEYLKGNGKKKVLDISKLKMQIYDFGDKHETLRTVIHELKHLTDYIRKSEIPKCGLVFLEKAYRVKDIEILNEVLVERFVAKTCERMGQKEKRSYNIDYPKRYINKAEALTLNYEYYLSKAVYGSNHDVERLSDKLYEDKGMNLTQYANDGLIHNVAAIKRTFKEWMHTRKDKSEERKDLFWEMPSRTNDIEKQYSGMNMDEYSSYEHHQIDKVTINEQEELD